MSRIPTLTTKITERNNYFSLICVNINGLSSTIKKRYKLTNWLHKQDPTFCYTQETHLSDKDRHYFKLKDWKKVPSKWSQGGEKPD
jgi:exonuclease III